MARGLAGVLVVGPWCEEELIARGAVALGRRWRFLRPLARRLTAAFDSGMRPRSARVADFLLQDAGFVRAWRRHYFDVSLKPGPDPTMCPAPGRSATWAVPSLTTPVALADWLGLTVAEMEGLADCQGRSRKTTPGPLRHYSYRWVAKAAGSARLVESPRPLLKTAQRRILDDVLAIIPPHDAAHGFRAGRSTRSFVEPHVGRRAVLKLDLRDFFPTITSGRVTSLFIAAGYPEPVARRLSGLCTNRPPADIWRGPGCPASGPEAWRIRRLYAEAHLPQGAPTSPALANLCAYRLDARLAGLAASAGAAYTRYADDLAFSGGRDFERSLHRFAAHVGAVALEEGFVVNPRKTRAMRQGVCQRLAGVVVNERPNLSRAEFDVLKATLHNCVRHGPAGQNRDGHPAYRAHLAGRIAYLASLHPERGAKLREQFERIRW